ncbi:MAG: tyrosine--tRNA ligase, partial [Sphingomonadaceae bacterium]|nr:tyrosine--tRNA ligase [Sphingomonadaceae bacterium]
DRDVGRFLRLFTDLPLDEIQRLEALGGSEINAAKIALANAATELCRGADAATLASETARKTFEEGTSGGDLPSLVVSGDISLIDALVGLGFVASKKEARRMIQGGGARVDGDAVTADDAVISAQAAAVKISAGKKKHGLINFV